MKLQKKLLAVVVMLAMIIAAVYLGLRVQAMTENDCEFSVYDATQDGEDKADVLVMVDNKYHHEYIWYNSALVERDMN